MKITLDSSGRTRNIREKNIIALSNEIKFSVLLKASVKKKLYNRFNKKKYGIRISDKHHHIKIHCIALTYCLKNYINKAKAVQICPEGFNKRFLTLYLKLFMEETYDDTKIVFLKVGKKDGAHIHANRIRKKIEEPNMILSTDDFIKILKKSGPC